jgi:hypothetical protein
LFLLGTNAVLADTIWTRTYHGPYGGDNAARVVLTDTFANTVVVGSSAGESGSGGSDIVAIKYSWFHGNTIWTTRITGGAPSDDVAMDAAIDPTAAVNITGQTGSSPDFNILTVQLNPNGSEVWRATYDGTAHAADVGTAIAVDTLGSVFVAGYAQNSSMDFVTIKYNWDGSRVWVKTYDGGGDDKATDIALGPDGSVYVTGNSVRGGYDDFATVKYSAAGAEEWVAFYNGTNNVNDQAAALAVDAEGSAYVTGPSFTGDGPGSTTHFATVKYDSSGAEQWVARYEPDGSEPAALALGASALYVTGQTAPQGDADYATIAYDLGTGDTLWVRRDSGPTGSGDAAVGIALGSDSSIWVGGSSNYDFMSVLYTPDGVQRKVVSYGGAGDDGMAAIAVDKANKVVVTGNTWAGGGYDILTVKFDTLPYAVAEPPARGPFSGIRFSVTPNPSASGLATLRFSPGNARSANITVAGVDGRVVMDRSIETYATKGTYTLDIGRLEAGVYIVRLESDGRSATQKLVVGH